VIKRYNNADAYAIAIGIWPTGCAAAGRSSPPGRATTAR
jgi:membrane-bound lytic murein transglycosylase B